MAWTSPRIWLEGAIITAPQMNAVSANLNETAPAKAQDSGDLFYATGSNEIDRLAIGKAGDVLTPLDGVPRWTASPTPITTQGDMVYGNTAGNATRLPVGASGQILVCRNRRVQWVDRVDKRDWWEQDEWWLDGAPENTYQIAAGGALPGWPFHSPMLVSDRLVISGTIDIGINPTVIRAREIVLQGDTTINVRQRRFPEPRYPFGSQINTIVGAAGGAGAVMRTGGVNGEAGSPGRKACGGGGGGGGTYPTGSNGNTTTEAQNGESAPSTVNMADIREALYGRAEFYGGQGRVIGTAHDYAGGCLILAAKTLTRMYNGSGPHTLTINADGDSHNSPPYTTTSASRAGSGGGLAMVIIKDGTEGVTVTANGGIGLPQAGARSRSGNGGNGTAYLGTAFPE